MPREIKEQYIPHSLEQKLGYLMEECGEVMHATGKSIRWGFQGANPEIPEEERITNAQWLLDELNDLKRAISWVENHLEKEKDNIDKVIFCKKDN